MPSFADLVREAIERFCREFLKSPYLCYTEHGLHARFYGQLFESLPNTHREVTWNGQTVCAVQKEYPTAGALERSRRQNWDIAVIGTPPRSVPGKSPSYDYLALDSVVEFGLNASKVHLDGDIERLCHPKSNVTNKFIVHLYRISEAGEGRFSSRDLSVKSRQVLEPDEIHREILRGRGVKIYYGRADLTGTYESGLWRIDPRGVTEIR